VAGPRLIGAKIASIATSTFVLVTSLLRRQNASFPERTNESYHVIDRCQGCKRVDAAISPVRDVGIGLRKGERTLAEVLR
jgi:hypothetical protein